MYVKFRKAMIHKKSNMSYMHPKTLYMVSSPFHIEFMGVRELKKKYASIPDDWEMNLKS